MNIFHTLLFVPLFNGLIAVHYYLPWHDLGLAIIGLTLVVLLILYWPSLMQIKSSQALQELQPKLKTLQNKYKDDKQELARQTMALYREHKFNPLSSCLPLLIQLPILLAMYQVIMGVKVDAVTHLLPAERVADLYGHLAEVYATTPIDPMAFGFINLAATHNIPLALLVGATQYLLTRLLSPKTTPPNVPGAGDERGMTAILRQMNYITPFTFAFVSYILPAGLSLYYITWNLFQIGQRLLVARTKKNAATIS